MMKTILPLKNKSKKKIQHYDGLIIRSRFTIDAQFLDAAKNLKFIGRVGAGLENIDVRYARNKDIFIAAAPEGNRNAVGEHALGMLLSLMNNFNKAHREVRKGIWDREGNRGVELEGKNRRYHRLRQYGQGFRQETDGLQCRRGHML